ncbi:MAG: bacterioferritin [Neisseriaceae bacterium]|nr:MAG: bacterioferritin [Neisseriaceae bacterium]
MKGNQKVVDCLNKLLAGELMARDQYFIHSEMYRDWGYEKLYTKIHHEMSDEAEHARQFIARILLLQGTPKVVPEALHIGHDVPSMLRADLDIELKVRENLKKGITLCEQENDFITREILVQQLLDTEEDHAYWLEQQLRLIDEMGLKNYLQSNIK